MIKETDSQLGTTGIVVSRLGYGTVYMGPDGDKLTADVGAALLLHAFRLGIYYWDTSDDYGSHPHVAQTLKQLDRSKVVISSKTRLPEISPIESILDELETDYLDVLLTGVAAISDRGPVRNHRLRPHKPQSLVSKHLK